MHLKIVNKSIDPLNDTHCLHLHVMNTREKSYYLLSVSDQLSWQSFLMDGLLDSQIKRVIEVSRDEQGGTKIIRDMIR